MQQNQKAVKQTAHSDIARALVSARSAGRPIKTYPGAAPQTLADAYEIQDAAINLWPDAINGWKVGRITGADEARFGVDRLVGPIFKTSIKRSQGSVAMPVFVGGFAAVEGEVVITLGADAPADKLDWTTEEASALIGAISAGVEVASSPFAGINNHGPLVTISDFGNNNGLILGDDIPDWQSLQFCEWRCETFIDGVSVGSESPAAIPGGPIESLRFLLALSARRGLPLKKGMAISTGAVTGVHEINVGQSAAIHFKGVNPIHCEILGFAPTDPNNKQMRQSA